MGPCPNIYRRLVYFRAFRPPTNDDDDDGIPCVCFCDVFWLTLTEANFRYTKKIRLRRQHQQQNQQQNQQQTQQQTQQQNQQPKQQQNLIEFGLLSKYMESVPRF